MKDLTTIRKGITHAGRFHLDDVMATAFLKSFQPELEIVRVEDYEGEPMDDEIVYDVGFGEFDHHQEEPRLDERGVPYSAFGLLFEVYGREYLMRQGAKDVEEAFARFKKNHIYSLNYGDNRGWKEVEDCPEHVMIRDCNLLWFESEEMEERQFEKAVKLGEMFLESWTFEAKSKEEQR